MKHISLFIKCFCLNDVSYFYVGRKFQKDKELNGNTSWVFVLERNLDSRNKNTESSRAFVPFFFQVFDASQK